MGDLFGLGQLTNAMAPAMRTMGTSAHATELAALAQVADVLARHGFAPVSSDLLALVAKRVREEVLLQVTKEKDVNEVPFTERPTR